MPLEFFSVYKVQTADFVNTTDKPSWQRAKEHDEAFLSALIAAHKNLQPNQRLVITVNTKIPEGIQEGNLDGYAGVVNDAPFNFRRHLENIMNSPERLTVDGYIIGQDWDDAIEITIPPDVYPEENLGVNTSGSRSAVLGGQVRRFLDSFSARDQYLKIKPSGAFVGNDLIFHPSLILNTEIIEVEQGSNTIPICTFKSIKS